MSKEIHNLKELNSLGRELEYGDHIYFTTNEGELKYVVSNTFLNCYSCTGKFNNEIFDRLNLNDETKGILAKKWYGYSPTPPNDYDWPEYKQNDYKAAERLIREIYKIHDIIL